MCHLRALRRMMAAVVALSLLSPLLSLAKKSSAKRHKKVTVADIKGQLASLKRSGRFRSNLCWKRFYDARRAINRQQLLLLRFHRYPCDAKAWRKCHRRKYKPAACSDKDTRLRFGACFRIHRRLFVIAHRLKEWRKEARKGRCRWRLRIPDSFSQVVFSPYPRISKK